jgi:hypothetical protein
LTGRYEGCTQEEHEHANREVVFHAITRSQCAADARDLRHVPLLVLGSKYTAAARSRTELGVLAHVSSDRPVPIATGQHRFARDAKFRCDSAADNLADSTAFHVALALRLARPAPEQIHALCDEMLRI